MAESKIRKFLEDLEERELECSICLKRLQQPTALNCLHSFCMPCLHDWVKAKGELICPTCLKSYPIPDGGLEKLPPNTYVNYLIQTIDQMGKKDKCGCNCEIGKNTTYYCQECRHYMCSTCYDHYKKFRGLTNHILQPIEDVRSMTPVEVSSLHRPKYQITELKQYRTGNTNVEKVANCFKVHCRRYICATQYQTITVKLVKVQKCDIGLHASQIKATWTFKSTKKANMTPVHEDDDGNFIVKRKCTTVGLYKLDISIDCVPVKHSPVLINVEKEGLVNTIEVGKRITDVAWCDQDNCLLVAYLKNEIYKYKLTGEYIGKMTLPEGVRVKRMHKLKNDKLAFSDDGNYKCIKICTMDGQVKKTVGKGYLEAPSGVKVNEELTIVYATSFFNKGVFKFSMYNEVTFVSDLTTKTNVYNHRPNGYNDVTFTKDGKLLFLNHIYSRLELFDKERFSKVLVWPGDDDGKIMEPGGVVVDDDGNIIISSINKLQLFDSDGNFIKRIDKQEDGINFPWGLAIISYHPRRVALANHGDSTVKIFNY